MALGLATLLFPWVPVKLALLALIGMAFVLAVVARG
jgi:hypothetical protein